MFSLALMHLRGRGDECGQDGARQNDVDAPGKQTVEVVAGLVVPVLVGAAGLDAHGKAGFAAGYSRLGDAQRRSQVFNAWKRPSSPKWSYSP